MSAALQWSIIRKNNSFLHKNPIGDHALFSKEANNLTAKHSFKFSGLAVGIVADPTRGVVISVKTHKGTQPKNAFKSVKLSRGARPTLSAVAALTAGSAPDYRADLKKFALARASAILLSQKKKTPKVRKGRVAKK